VSPRRNARAAAPRAPAHRPATRGRTRALGQHFLRDRAVVDQILELVRPTGRDLVVEIGPGRGALTEALAARAGRLLALEIDAALVAQLQERFAVEIRQADARQFDYAGLRARALGPDGRVLVVGNLPYSVGKPILAALVESGGAIDEMALMLQKEVAERVAALPGSKTYGALSVLTQVSAAVRLAFSVPPGAFSPPPQVDSAVLYLRLHREAPVPIGDAARFGAVVRAAFSQRRKSLANALAAGLAISAERARRQAEAAGIDPGRRAETLSLAEFARLAAPFAGPDPA
jgi:16S rRNA (adenine1518-N6/adenine1519-N6)-dimethyltransferase